MEINTHTDGGLAARLRRETRELHTLAERSGVMAALLQQRISEGGYCALLGNLHAIYAALESSLDGHLDDLNVKRLWRPELRRLPSLAQDLALLQREGSEACGAVVPATAAYVGRLQSLASTAPTLLLAHAYVRYLGDLHGGQLMCRLVRQRFALGSDAGTAFYAFGDADQVKRLCGDFRDGLDQLALSPAQAGAFVAEACDAFQRHRQLFEELQALHPSPALQPGAPA